MKQDWTGNRNSIYRALGASNHAPEKREINDYYATDPKAMELLLNIESFAPNIWECACGEGHLSKVLVQRGHNVRSTDLIDRGYGEGGVDFLSFAIKVWDGDIITNPPYKYAQLFIEKALKIIPPGNKVAMFLKIQFLEGKARQRLFLLTPPRTVYVSSSRILCAKNGKFAKEIMGKKIAEEGVISSSAVAYGWFVWEKGFSGTTELKWFN